MLGSLKEPTESSRTFLYYALILLTGAFKSAIFFTVYEVLACYHTLTFLFFVKLSSTWPTHAQCFRIFRHSCVRILLDIMWVTGLILCGPFRGAAFFILGVVCVIFFDHDVTDSLAEHPEGVHKSLLIHRIYEFFIYCGLSDHKAGAVLLILAACFESGFHSFSRGLAADIGGAKRLHALSTCASLVPLSILIFLGWIYGTVFLHTASSDLVTSPGGLSRFYRLCVIASTAFAMVAEFYCQQFVANKIGPHRVSKMAYQTVVLTALLISFYLTRTAALETDLNVGHINGVVLNSQPVRPSHYLSTGVIFGMLSMLYASSLLNQSTANAHERLFSRHFVGFSAAGLPLYTTQPSSSGYARDSVFGLRRHAFAILKQVLADRASFRIFIFLCLNLSFTFVELFYGVWTNSLGLISDGFHMLFDCAALVMGLYASVVGRWKPDRIFSFGFHRAEILSGFVNSLALLIIAGSIAINALLRIQQPPDINTDRLMAVSVGGLLVNLVGIFALGHTHSHSGAGSHGHSHSNGAHGHSHEPGHNHSHSASHGHSHDCATVVKISHNSADGGLHCKHDDENCEAAEDASTDSNLRGVYLHVLADTLGSVGVIISSYFVANYGWNVADPICSLFISGAIVYSALPLVVETIYVLALRAPNSFHPANPDRVIQKVLELDSVLEVLNPCVWKSTEDTICCSLRVRLTSEASEQLILAQIKDALRQARISHLTVQLEKDSFSQHMEAFGLNVNSVNRYRRSCSVKRSHPHEHINNASPCFSAQNTAWTTVSF
ncbi:hypothetical protein SprV_0200791500 [Sparganum proliferum]